MLVPIERERNFRVTDRLLTTTSESVSASPRGTAVLLVTCVTAAIPNGSPIDPTEDNLEIHPASPGSSGRVLDPWGSAGAALG